MRRAPIWILSALAVAIASPAFAETQTPVPSPTNLPDAPVEPATQFTVAAGASDWSGDYGAKSDSDIAALLLTGRYKIGDLRLTASVPYMRIQSDGAVFAGIEGTPIIVSPSIPIAKKVRDGFGDVTLGASYLLPFSPALGADLDVSARVKIPTASKESGLSTGQADYALGAEVSKPIGRFVPFVSFTYRDFGDSTALQLKDGFATSVGLNYFFSDRWIGGLSYDYAERASRFIPDSHEIVASFSTVFKSTNVRLTGFAGAGLSNGAAAISGGLSLSLAL